MTAGPEIECYNAIARGCVARAEASMSTQASKEDTAKTDRDALRVLLANARLNPGPEQFEEIVDAFVHVKAMTARLHSGFPFEAEPAHVFTPTKFQTKF
jgi:hypothetical protein